MKGGFPSLPSPRPSHLFNARFAGYCLFYLFCIRFDLASRRHKSTELFITNFILVTKHFVVDIRCSVSLLNA